MSSFKLTVTLDPATTKKSATNIQWQCRTCKGVGVLRDPSWDVWHVMRQAEQQHRELYQLCPIEDVHPTSEDIRTILTTADRMMTRHEARWILSDCVTLNNATGGEISRAEGNRVLKSAIQYLKDTETV